MMTLFLNTLGFCNSEKDSHMEAPPLLEASFLAQLDNYATYWPGADFVYVNEKTNCSNCW